VSQSTIANWEAARGLTRHSARRVYRALLAMPGAVAVKPGDLVALRAQRGWAQAELARRLGVSLPTVKRWELGTYPIPPRRYDRLRRLIELPDRQPRRPPALGQSANPPVRFR
jgi:hypothetical protein